jgi:hypothetical protein
MDTDRIVCCLKYQIISQGTKPPTDTDRIVCCLNYQIISQGTKPPMDTDRIVCCLKYQISQGTNGGLTPCDIIW